MESHHGPSGMEAVKSNGLAEGFSRMIAILPGMSFAIIQRFNNPVSLQKTSEDEHNWKAEGHGH
jgi:hypothetical protein